MGVCAYTSIQFTRCISSHNLGLTDFNCETVVLIGINEPANDVGDVTNPTPIIPDQVKAAIQEYVEARTTVKCSITEGAAVS